MNTIIKQIPVDIYTPTFYEVIKAQQGDKNSRLVEFILFNQGEPYILPDNIAIKLEGQRANKSPIVKPCSFSNNTVTVELDEDLLYYHGICHLKIVIYKTDDHSILSTIPFTLSVQKNPLESDAFEKDHYSLLNQLILETETNAKNLDDEVKRAMASENTLTNLLNNEITRATDEENKLTDILKTNKPIWDDKYTKNEVDNKFSTLETNIDWKESVDTYDDITTIYPNPVDGWTVNVKDTDYTYRYNGTEWVIISANAIPKATDSVDGLLSADDKIKLDGIENGAQVNTVTSVNGQQGDIDIFTLPAPIVIPTLNNADYEDELINSVCGSGNIDAAFIIHGNIGNDSARNTGLGKSLQGIIENGVYRNKRRIDSIEGILSDITKGTVTGVKGEAESEYRTGNVNITPENIGAISKNGDYEKESFENEYFMDNSGRSFVEKHGRICVLNIAGHIMQTMEANSVIATISTNFRPHVQTLFPVYCYNNVSSSFSGVSLCIVETNGNIKLNSGYSTITQLTNTIPINTWIWGNASWIV